MANQPGFTPAPENTGATPGFTLAPETSTTSDQESQINTAADPWRRVSTGQGWLDQLKEVPGAIAQGVKNITGAIPSMAGQTGMPSYLSGTTGINPALSDVNKAQQESATGAAGRADQISALWGHPGIAGKVEAGGRAAGTVLGPLGGDWAIGMGEKAGQGGVLPAAAESAVTLGAMEGGAKILRDASKLIERAPTVEQGKIGYVNQARAAAAKLDNAVRTTGVGARAQSVIAADTLDNARKGVPGQVNTVDATMAGQAFRDKTKLGGVAGGFKPQMSLDEAKATITQLGREASRLERQGKAPEAGGVWAEYDGLRKATQARADELGGQHGKNWSDYITEHKNYMQLQNGVLGHLTEGEHTGSLNKLIEHQGQLPELQKWFDKYGIDMKPIQDAATEGKKLNELTQQSSNALMGKIKLLSRHPVLGLPAVIGAHAGMAAAGISGAGLGFILPLIIAGKVGGLLDRAQVHNILVDLGKRIPEEQMQIAGNPKGPMPEPPPSGGSAAPTQPAPVGTTGSYTNMGPEPVTTPHLAEPSERRVTGASDRRMGGGYEGPEQRVTERRYSKPQIGTPGEPGIKPQKTGGEEIEEALHKEQVEKASKETRFDEGHAVAELAKDPAKWKQYKELREKTVTDAAGNERPDKVAGKQADAMLVDIVREMKKRKK